MAIDLGTLRVNIETVVKGETLKSVEKDFNRFTKVQQKTEKTAGKTKKQMTGLSKSLRGASRAASTILGPLDGTAFRLRSVAISLENNEHLLASFASRLGVVGTVLSTIGTALAGTTAGLLALGSAAAVAGDRTKGLRQQIRVVTDSTAEFTNANSKLRDIAFETGVPIRRIIDSFQRLSQVQNTLGASGGDILEVVETLEKLGQSTGATSNELNRSFVQLNQALSEGRVTARNFRSVLEATPGIATAIAREFDGAAGSAAKLLEMIKAGEVSSQDLFEAIKQIDESQIEFLQRFNQSFTRLQQAFGELFTNIDDLTGASDKTVGVLNEIASGTRDFATAIGGLEKAPDTIEAIESRIKRLQSLQKVPAVFEAENFLDPLGTIGSFFSKSAQQLIFYQQTGRSTSEVIKRLQERLKEVEKASNDVNQETKTTQEILSGMSSESRRLSDDLEDLSEKLRLSELRLIAFRRRGEEGLQAISAAKAGRDARDEAREFLDSLTEAERKAELARRGLNTGRRGEMRFVQMRGEEARARVENIQKLKEEQEQARETAKAVNKLSDAEVERLKNLADIQKQIGFKSVEEQKKIGIQTPLSFEEQRRALLKSNALTREINRKGNEEQRKRVMEGKGLQTATDRTLSGFKMTREQIRETEKDVKKFEENIAMTFEEKLTKAVKNWGDTFASQLTDMFFQADTTFKDIARSFARMISQMVLKQTVAQPIADLASAGISSGFGAIGFARGGIVDKPTMLGSSGGKSVVAGEGIGKEAVLPLTRGSGGDLGVKAIGGGEAGGVTINQNFSISANGDEQVANVAREAAAQGIREASPQIIKASSRKAQDDIRRSR